MMLTIDRHWEIIDKSDLLFVDDVNAFDEREHLRLLEDLDCPMLFATATPDELRRFLDRIGALKNIVSMKKMPFDVLPTKIHKVEGVWGEPPAEQLSRADALIKEHLARGSRIFVIGRTRGDVPRLAERLEHTYDIDVEQLRGDMADTSEQSKRYRRKGVQGQRGRHAHRDDEQLPREVAGGARGDEPDRQRHRHPGRRPDRDHRLRRVRRVGDRAARSAASDAASARRTRCC